MADENLQIVIQAFVDQANAAITGLQQSVQSLGASAGATSPAIEGISTAS